MNSVRGLRTAQIKTDTLIEKNSNQIEIETTVIEEETQEEEEGGGSGRTHRSL